MFWLKKAVSYWLMPLPFCVVLLFVGLVLARSERRRKCGLCLATVGAVLLFVFSNTYVSTHLLRPLETHYPPIPELTAAAGLPNAIAGCRFVAVLGSGSTNTPGLAATSQLFTAGLGRIVEAVRILKVLPDARLIVSGPGEPGERTHAAVLAAAAVSLGIAPSRITLIENGRDTEEEAFAVSRIVGSARTALVTSAWHMPRAARLFTKAGIDFVPCPADFGSRPEDLSLHALFRFDSDSLERSTEAVHEDLGLLWVRLRGAR